MKFRPDIDGLRALSVLAVFIFHINKHLLSGGFAGVDAFFVISGFLITSIIFANLQQNNFSFGEFYMRRLRRIQPVMWVVVLVTFVIALVLFSPTDLTFLANSIRSVLSFTSNYFFAKNSDYFNPHSEQYPLLHFWSLAVEEQYYLFWPLILFTLYKLKMGSRGILAVVILIIISSTLGGEWLLHQPKYSSLAYFILPTRMGELSIGGLLAILMQMPLLLHSSLKSSTRNLLSVIGTLMLVASFLLFSEATLFPGIASLLPCGGVFLLIYAGPEALVNKVFFSWRPVVFIGSLSYSIYLWHFPILAFLRYAGQLNPWTSVLAVLLVFLLSLWTKFKIEDKFRHVSTSFLKALWRFQIKPGIIGLMIVMVTYDSGGLQQRYFLSKGDMIEDMNPFYDNYCHQQILPDCRIGDKTKPTIGLIFGDSHANHFMPFWEKIGQVKGFALEARSATSCAPIFADMEGDEVVCTEQKKWFREHYAQFKTIILNARWEYIFTDIKFPAPVRVEIQKRFAETLEVLAEHHINVIVMPQIPVISDTGYEQALKEKYFLLGYYLDSKEQEVPVSFGPGSAIANQHLKDFLVPYPWVKIFDPVAACPEVRARWPYREHGMAYRDDNHLTLKGAQGLANCYLAKNLPLPLSLDE